MVDHRSVGQAAETNRVGDDGFDFLLVIAQGAQCVGDGPVDDLEITATGELLEFDQSEVRLDSGRIAVHDQPNGARRGDDRGLRVAEAVFFAELQCAVPGFGGCGGERRFRTGAVVERRRRNAQPFVTVIVSVRGPAMVANDAQHRFGIPVVFREGAELFGHFRRRGVGDACHQRGDRAAQGAALIAVIGQAGPHQQTADIGVTETQGTVVVGPLRDLLGGELCHQYGDFQGDRPQPHRVLEHRDIDAALLTLERHQIQRGQVACRVVEEHVLRARVGGVDAAGIRAGVPFVDRGVELQTRVGGRPGGVGNLVPQILGADGLRHFAVLAVDQVPVLVVTDSSQKVVCDADRIVGVLSGYRQIGVGIPIRVVGLELDGGVTLTRELDDPLDVVLRHIVLARRQDCLFQRLILLWIEAGVVFALLAGVHNRAQAAIVDARAGHQGCDLVLFDHLPVDVILDIRMVDIDDDHLGGAPRGAAGFDRAGRPVADLEEAHQAGGFAAAGQRFALGADAGEVAAGAGAVFEQAGFADPQIHDAAFVDQVIVDGLDEASVRLRMLIG